jgi:hypothetical protein
MHAPPDKITILSSKGENNYKNVKNDTVQWSAVQPEIILDTIHGMYYHIKHEKCHTHHSIGRRPQQAAG